MADAVVPKVTRPTWPWFIASSIIFVAAFGASVAFGFGGPARLGVLHIDTKWFIALAGFFVGVQALQRLLDLFAAAVGVATGDQAATTADDANAQAAKVQAQTVAGAPAGADAANAAATASTAKTQYDQLQANKQVFVAAAGTLLAVVGAGVLHLYLLAALSNASGAATALPQGWQRTMDLFVTALALAGGSKPLNDLITRIQQSSESSKTAA